MATRAHHCLKVRTAMTELQAVVADAAGLPVYVAEVEAVGGLLAKAQDWLKKAAAAASQVRNKERWLFVVLAVLLLGCIVIFFVQMLLYVCRHSVSVSFCFVLL
jgi:hypothetical protein